MRLYPSPLVKINIIDWDVLLLFVIFPFLYPAFYRAAINFTLHFLLYTLSNQRQSLCVFCQWRFSIAPFVLFLRLSSILMVFELMRFYWDRCRGLFAYSFIVEGFFGRLTSLPILRHICVWTYPEGCLLPIWISSIWAVFFVSFMWISACSCSHFYNYVH